MSCRFSDLCVTKITNTLSISKYFRQHFSRVAIMGRGAIDRARTCRCHIYMEIINELASIPPSVKCHIEKCFLKR